MLKDRPIIWFATQRGQVPVSHKIMKTEIKIFTSDIFGEIRTCQVNNQIMFVGKDVATALGYSNSRKALLDHVDDEDRGVNELVTPGGKQDLAIINESGLYSQILYHMHILVYLYLKYHLFQEYDK